jgi:hypothetical protein
MWFISTGIRLGAPGISVGSYIWKGIIPAGLGNIVGGGVFVAVIFWYLHVFQEPPVDISAVQQAGLGGRNETPSGSEGNSSNFFKGNGRIAVKPLEPV